MKAGVKTVSLEEILAAAGEPAVEEGSRAVLVFGMGDRLYALEAGLVERVAERRFIAPLPAPLPNMLGVASVSGRMRLVLDPSGSGGAAHRNLVVLHGEGQLALTAERVHAVLTVPEGEPVQHDGREAEEIDPERLIEG